jgi:hypothetical protein
MKRYLRMIRGSNFLQTGTASGELAGKAGNAPDRGVMVVQRNSRLQSAAEAGLDLAAVEERARAARSAWMGSKLKSYYEALVRKYEKAGQAKMENYLAASQNLADLEERIRRYERTPLRYY